MHYDSFFPFIEIYHIVEREQLENKAQNGTGPTAGQKVSIVKGDGESSGSSGKCC